MIKLIFILLDDINSNNTLSILSYIDENIEIINKKNYYIEILPIKKDILNTNDFIKFRESNNICSIPAIIINNMDHGNQLNQLNTISDSKNVAQFLENIVCNNNNQIKNNNAIDNDSVYDNDDSNTLIESYMNKEICNKQFNTPDDFLSQGHGDNNEIMKKMKDFNKQKNNVDINNTSSSIKHNLSESFTEQQYNNTNMHDSSNNAEAYDNQNLSVEEAYSNKLYNKQKKNSNLKQKIKSQLGNTHDDQLISEKFLNNIDDDNDY
jgi:hypothetical protein